MKLVINVPDYIKEQADDGKGEEFGIPLWLAYEIANGTSLDKIRAEIMQVANEEKFHDEKWALGLRHAVTIIDKCKPESEE